MKKTYLIFLFLVLNIRPYFLISVIKIFFNIRRKKIKTNNGYFIIDPVNHFGYELISKGVYKKQVLTYLTNLLSNGDNFVDLGANEGYFGIVTSKLVGDNGLIISIEPQSRLTKIILKNKDANKIKNLFVEKLAISDSNSIANLNLSSNINSGLSKLGTKKLSIYNSEYVKTKTLTYIFKKYRLSNVKVLKIDIEGYEYEAIFGSKDLFLNHFIENIIIEIHQNLLIKKNKKKEDIIKFLENCGYKKSKELCIHNNENNQILLFYKY